MGRQLLNLRFLRDFSLWFVLELYRTYQDYSCGVLT
ncbi:hypothetical protein SLEP1_g50458 [Rubroshorea leprosula]|uniref:Maturase K n=1 Tax=Rubroshorea leprosula TaxID=152421 RepID=A0AAV5M0U2_9ROSI|nr:hypothetical protein SLEP1_g50458 [Rubroshorea leprosula]